MKNTQTLEVTVEPDMASSEHELIDAVFAGTGLDLVFSSRPPKKRWVAMCFAEEDGPDGYPRYQDIPYSRSHSRCAAHLLQPRRSPRYSPEELDEMVSKLDEAYTTGLFKVTVSKSTPHGQVSKAIELRVLLSNIDTVVARLAGCTVEEARLIQTRLLTAEDAK